MHRNLSADIICSEKRTVFRERSSRKTVSIEEQIMSNDKYPSIFSSQMETIVFIIPQIFFATRAVLKTGEYPQIFPNFTLGIFGHVTCLDQSRASENIWWIISTDICPWTLSVPWCSQFPWATLSENCSLLGTDNVHGQISVHIFAWNGDYCLFIPLTSNVLRIHLFFGSGAGSVFSFLYLRGGLNESIIPLTLVGYKLVKANLALCASLAFYHLVYNKSTSVI